MTELLKDFSILGPSIKGLTYKEDYYIEKNVIVQFIIWILLLDVRFFNMKALNEIGKFDENIFILRGERSLFKKP